MGEEAGFRTGEYHGRAVFADEQVATGMEAYSRKFDFFREAAHASSVAAHHQHNSLKRLIERNDVDWCWNPVVGTSDPIFLDSRIFRVAYKQNRNISATADCQYGVDAVCRFITIVENDDIRLAAGEQIEKMASGRIGLGIGDAPSGAPGIDRSARAKIIFVATLIPF